MSTDATPNNQQTPPARPPTNRPTARQLKRELDRLRHQREVRSGIWSVVSTLVVIAAATVLVLTMWLPVYRIQRSSMAPSLRDGEVVVFMTTGNVSRGDVIAFHYGGQVLIKRVIGITNDWVDIAEDGTVFVNDEPVDEPYLSLGTQAYNWPGDTGRLPQQVMDNHFFVMGDQRRLSIDSRDEEIGQVRGDQLIGRALVRLWPMERFGAVR